MADRYGISKGLICTGGKGARKGCIAGEAGAGFGRVLGRFLDFAGRWGILRQRMIAAMDQAKAPERKASPPKVRRYTGEVVYIYAFDVAYEMTRQPVRELLGQPVAQFVVDASKRSPRQLFFYRPQMVRLPPLERIGPHGPVRVERVIKLLPVGAISISVRVPFEVEQVEDLVCLPRPAVQQRLAERGGAAAGGRGARRAGAALRPARAASLRRRRPTRCSAWNRRW